MLHFSFNHSWLILAKASNKKVNAHPNKINYLSPMEVSKYFSQYVNQINWNKVINQIVNDVIQILLVTFVFWIINRIGQSIIRRLFKSNHLIKDGDTTQGRAQTLYTLTANVYRYTIYFFYIYAILSILGVPVGTLIASAGIVSIAVGLSAQGLAKDVINGFFILLEKQYDVGDTVQIGQVLGNVVSVGLRTTQLLTPNGVLTFIPNRNISEVSNLSRETRRLILQIYISPDTDIPAMEKVIDQTNDQLKSKFPQLEKAPKKVGVGDLGNGHLAYQVALYMPNGQQFVIQDAYWQAYLAGFKQANIKLADNLAAVIQPNNADAPL